MARFFRDARGRWRDAKGRFVKPVYRDPSLSSGWRHVTGRPARRTEIIRGLRRDVKYDPTSPTGYRRSDGTIASAEEVEKRKERIVKPPPRVLPTPAPYVPPPPPPARPDVFESFPGWQEIITFPGWDETDPVLRPVMMGLLLQIRPFRGRTYTWRMRLVFTVPGLVDERPVEVRGWVRGSFVLPRFREQVADAFLHGLWREMDNMVDHVVFRAGLRTDEIEARGAFWTMSQMVVEVE